MIAVNYLLIDFLANLANPTRRSMDNKEHEEGLLFTKLGKRLQNVVCRIIAKIRRKLVPNEDNTGILKMIPLDYVGNPLFKHRKRCEEAPSLIAIDAGHNISRLQASVYHVITEFFNGAILFIKTIGRICKEILPVNRGIVYGFLCCCNQRVFPVICS